MTPVQPKSPRAGTWAGNVLAFEQRRSADWDTCHGVGRGLLQKGGEIFRSLQGRVPGQAVASSLPLLAPILVPTLQNGPPASPLPVLPHTQHYWDQPGAPPARVAGPGAIVTPGEPFGRALRGLMGNFIDPVLQSGFRPMQLSARAPRRGESIQPPCRACWERTSR